MILGVIAFFAAGFLLSLNPFAVTPSMSSDDGNEINLDQNHRSLRLGYFDPKTVTRKVVPAENKNVVVECPSLHSTAIQLANSVKFNLNSISETAIGRGLVAGSCKPSGWSYSLVFPKFDRRGQGWMSEVRDRKTSPVLIVYRVIILICAIIIGIGIQIDNGRRSGATLWI